MIFLLLVALVPLVPRTRLSGREPDTCLARDIGSRLAGTYSR